MAGHCSGHCRGRTALDGVVLIPDGGAFFNVEPFFTDRGRNPARDSLYWNTTNPRLSEEIGRTHFFI